jgi:hypothetical protein
VLAIYLLGGPVYKSFTLAYGVVVVVQCCLLHWEHDVACLSAASCEKGHKHGARVRRWGIGKIAMSQRHLNVMLTSLSKSGA